MNTKICNYRNCRKEIGSTMRCDSKYCSRIHKERERRYRKIDKQIEIENILKGTLET